MSTIAHPQSRRLGRTLGAAANAACLALMAFYLWCPVHRFPTPRPFHGQAWYNPYAPTGGADIWRKANLHVHSRAWFGLTNGRGTPDEVRARYRALGYDVASISNYQSIARDSVEGYDALAVYEHGFNVRKAHFLAVAPRSVDWLDYPFLQGRDEEQHRIDRLRAQAGLVILAHPRLRRAIADADLRSLTGYAAMEIGSTESRGVDAWDIALDAGRAVWGVANDDIHDAGAPNEAARFWTMIAASSLDAGALVAALKAGRAYAVFGRHGQADVALEAMTVVGDTLSVQLAGAPADLTLIGTGGSVLATATHVNNARWILPCDAPWARVVARTPTTRLFLEPLLRTENGAMPLVAATVAPVPTMIRRVLAIVLLLMAASVVRATALDTGAEERRPMTRRFREAA